MTPLAPLDVRTVGFAVALVVLAGAGAFAVQPSASGVAPVSFDETLTTGMTTADVREANEAGYEIPKAQVFYGQYPTVVGYYGIESVATHVDSGIARRQFGDPLAIYVTEFSGSLPTLTAEGYVELGNDPGRGWIRAREAYYVVGSRARTPAGPAILPFEARADARAFAEEYGGDVRRWESLGAVVGDRGETTRAELRTAVGNRSAWATETVDRRRALRSRPVSVVVGEDAPTLTAAVDRAPPNTTVAVPPGRYAANLTVDEPLTIRGAGPDTTLVGNGNGTVLTATANRVAVTSLSIEGVGGTDSVPANVGNASNWADRTVMIYGRSDAGVLLADADESLVADVRIETDASGVVLRHSDRSVVRNVTVDGTATPGEGSMGVLPMYSRVVVEETTVRGGRDGVYVHRSDGSVVRDNRLSDQRMGVHEMYTSGLLIRNNTASGSGVGVILMTRPEDNHVVGNVVFDNEGGITGVGEASSIARNRVFDNGIGITYSTTRSLVYGNTVVGNDVGIRAATTMPTNRVYGNDIADNDRPVDAGSGPVHVYTVDGRGNYWADATGVDRDGDGALDRAFRPTSRVDLAGGRTAGGPALVESPALALLRAVEGSVPGLRPGGAVDVAPLADPARPEALDAVRNRTDD